MLDIAKRQLKDKIFLNVVKVFSGLAVLPLLLILGYLFFKGISVVNWSFFVNLPKPVGELGGGISNAIIGTIYMVFIACVFSVPTGIMAGIYLAENSKSRLAYFVRLAVDILQSVPSVVVGMIVYIWIVVPMRSFSAFSGGVALALIMVPVIVRSTEETIKLIPSSLKEAAMALGVPYSRTILKVIVPASTSGIVTGILLSVARVAGETAPLLFTAFGSPYLSFDPGKPINSLPLLIFNYATSPYTEWHTIAWGASFVLVMGVLFLNIMAKVVTSKWKVQF